jgi:hypothetical protein
LVEFLKTDYAKDPKLVRKLIAGFGKDILRIAIEIKPEILDAALETKNTEAFDSLIAFCKDQPLKRVGLKVMKYAAFLGARGDVLALEFLKNLGDIRPQELEEILISALLKKAEENPHYNIRLLFEALPAMKGIKVFNGNLQDSRRDLDAVFEVFEELSNSIEFISLNSCLRGNEDLKKLLPALAKMPALKHLDLGHNLLNLPVGSLQGLHSLQYLNLESNGVDSVKTLQDAFESNPRLETLVMSSCGPFLDINWLFEILPPFENLKVLDISYTMAKDRLDERLIDLLPETSISTLVINSNTLNRDPNNALILAIAVFKTNVVREELLQREREANPDKEIKPNPLVVTTNLPLPTLSERKKAEIISEVRARFSAREMSSSRSPSPVAVSTDHSAVATSDLSQETSI